MVTPAETKDEGYKQYRLSRYNRVGSPLVTTGDGAELFEAEDMDSSDREKVLLKKYGLPLSDPTEQKEFLANVRSLVKLSRDNPASEHILRIIDYGVDDGTPFVVLDYYDCLDANGEISPTLRQKLELFDKTDKYDLPTVKSYLDQLKDVLIYVHKIGIYNLNIRPEHIHVKTGNDNVETLLLPHFKFGKRTRDTYVGDIIWLAPGQFDSNQLQDNEAKAADQYSLALLLYWLLTGTTPPRRNQHSQQRKLSEEPDAKKLGLPSALWDVLEKGMAERPEDRYESIDDFANAFEDACNVVPEAPVPNRVKRTISTFKNGLANLHSPTSRRNVLIFIMSAIVICIFIAAAYVFSKLRLLSPPEPIAKKPTPTPKPAPTSAPTPEPGSGILISTFNKHEDEVTVVAWSEVGLITSGLQSEPGTSGPERGSVASGDKSGIIYVWDATTGKILLTFARHTAAIVDIACGPYGKCIVSADAVGKVYLWDPLTGNLLNAEKNFNTYPAPVDSVRALAWSDSGEHLIFNIGNTALIFDYPYNLQSTVNNGFGQPDAPAYTGHRDAITCIAFNHYTKLAVTGSDDNTVKIWIPEDQRGNIPHPTLYTYPGHRSAVRAVSWSHDGKYIASGDENSTVQIWKAEGSDIGTPHFLYQHSSGTVNSVAFSPDGKYVASAGNDETVQVRDMNGKLSYLYKGHKGYVNSIAWVPSNQQQSLYMASASNDKTVQIWKLN